jgi:hypothetical protein
MRCILSFACALWLAGCSSQDFTPGRGRIVVAPEPSQLVVTTTMLRAAEADYPTINVDFSRYPRGSSDTITFRTYSIQYFNMANEAIAMTDVPQSLLPTPVTLMPAATDLPSNARSQLAILTPAIAAYLKDQPPPVTINARVKFDGESTASGPLQFTFNVPIQVLTNPASPTP